MPQAEFQSVIELERGNVQNKQFKYKRKERNRYFASSNHDFFSLL